MSSLECCQGKSIDVRNTAEASARHPLLNLSLGLLLGIATVPVSENRGDAERDLDKGGWFQLSGKTLGIISYGRIGEKGVKKTKGFGMIVVAY